MLRAILVPLILAGLTGTVAAEQTLIPTPYPDMVPGGGLPLNPDPSEIGGPQRLLDDPYPQILGSDAQGNPPISRHHHHQHLVPSISQRKYRVDRPQQ